MKVAVPFADRRDAGRRLAERLATIPFDHPVVLALPRGGVPVAAEVASALAAPLDVLLVRKLGVPYQPELAMGAIGEDGVRVVNDRVMRVADVSEFELAKVEQRERVELERRAQRYRAGRPRLDLTGCTAILVDDGIATGSTVRAACAVAREHGAERVVIAVPVAPPSAVAELRAACDDVIALESPESFYAIGQFYGDFSQTSDDEVVRLLHENDCDDDDVAAFDAEVEIDIEVRLAGHLTVPANAPTIVVFAHGSGSSRHSPRNQYVARQLNSAGLGTLLLDLLTNEEELDRAKVFDIELLAQRLAGATEWLRKQPAATGRAIAYFGASTGAGAALWAASEPDADIAAVVSRGGRPDLAGPRLGAVRAPTLLIVGGDDTVVVELNRDAQSRLRCESALRIVPGATHLFEEPGALDSVAALARDWFLEHEQ